MTLSEYDLEAIAEMIKKGYVIKENETYRVTVPIYTFDQYKAVMDMVKAFISNELVSIIQESVLVAVSYLACCILSFVSIVFALFKLQVLMGRTKQPI